MMLCGVSVVFNSLGDVLGLMCCKCSSKNGQVLVGFQSTEAFGCLHHAGGGPAQRHRGVSPSLHVAADAAANALAIPSAMMVPAGLSSFTASRSNPSRGFLRGAPVTACQHGSRCAAQPPNNHRKNGGGY